MSFLPSKGFGYTNNASDSFVFDCDIIGLSDYMYDCLQQELRLYLKDNQVLLSTLNVEGFNISYKLSYANPYQTESYVNKLILDFVHEKMKTMAMEYICDYSVSNLNTLKKDISTITKGKATAFASYMTNTVWFIGEKNVLPIVRKNYSSTSYSSSSPTTTSDLLYHSPIDTNDSLNPFIHSDSRSYNYPSRSSFVDTSDSFQFNQSHFSDSLFPSYPMGNNDSFSYNGLNSYRDSKSMMDTRSITSEPVSFISLPNFPPTSHKHRDDDDRSTSSYSTLSSASVNPLLYTGSSHNFPPTSFTNNTTDIKRKPFNPLTSEYEPKHNLNKRNLSCPLYSINLQSNGVRLSIGHNSEFATYMLAFLFDEFIDGLKSLNIVVDGYYLNDHGFFMIVPTGTKETDVDRVVTTLANKYASNLLKSQRLRIPLNNRQYISYLLYTAETMKGKVIVHRVNDESICFYGKDSELKRMYEEAKGIEVEILNKNKDQTYDDGEQKLKEYEDTITPLASVTSNQLQQIWKQGYTPRQLDSVDIGFNCFVSRCRRKELIAYVTKLLSAGDPIHITNIINCIDNYYLIFKGNSAPNRDRWKKYKSKVNAQEMNIDFDKVMVKVETQNPRFELLRQEVEKKSNNNATVWINNDTCYLVGERSALQCLQYTIQEFVT